MKQSLVWDAPVRLLHWLLAPLVIVALAIGLFGGEHGRLFPVHMLLGLVAAAVVLCRLVWGVVGTRYARFAGWRASPVAAMSYLASIVRRKPERHIGHNPASLWAIVLMLGLVLVLATTGILMGQGIGAAEEVHEVCAYLLLATIGVHLAGIAVHIVTHRENIVRSLVDGKKLVEEEESIASARPMAALGMLVLVAAWAAVLVANFDAATRTTRVPVAGWTITLGEAEGNGEGDDGD